MGGFLIHFAFIIYLTYNAYGLPLSTITVANYDVSNEGKDKKLTSSSTVVPSFNCTFLTANNDLSTDIDSHIKEDTRLLVFNIKFNGWNGSSIDSNQSDLYKPLHWVLARDELARAILLLDYDYETLSLFTLSLNTEKMDMYLNNFSPNCTEKFNSSTFEIAVRELIFDHVKENKEDDFLCNMHIVDSKGIAEFVYRCCYKNSDGKINCEDLTKNIWFTILFIFKIIVTGYIILDFPRFVPEIVYKNVKTEEYKHPLELSPLTLNVLLTRKQHKNEDKVINKTSLKSMKQFNETLNKMSEKPDVVYSLEIKDVQIKVEESDLILEGDAPVGLLRSVYEMFFMCEIRKLPSMSKCCYADMCQMCRKKFRKTTGENKKGEEMPLIPKYDTNCGQRTDDYNSSARCSDQCCSWYIVLSWIIKVVMFCFLILPWILRIWYFYRYEEEDLNNREIASQRRGLILYVPVFKLTEITLIWLTVDVIFAAVVLALSFISKCGVKHFFEHIQNIFNEMRERNIYKDFSPVLSVTLKACTRYGILGAICCCVVWIFALILVLIYILSLPYITISIFLKTFHLSTPYKNKYLSKQYDPNNCCNRLCFYFLSGICIDCALIIIFAYGFILSFCIDVIVYTSIGLILNVDTTLKYLSLTLMIVVYAKSCFSYVADRYLHFNVLIFKVLQNISKDKDTVAGNDVPIDQKENQVFRIKTNVRNLHEDPVSLEKTDFGLRWRISSLVLFVNKDNIISIPKKFFFEACKMPHYFCPGDVLMNYVRAFFMLITIVAYLVFILFVVLAFEGTSNLSPTNKLLFSLAGGLLPLIFQTVARYHVVSPLDDTSNINFNTYFDKLLETYKQDWPIDDIVVEKTTELQTSDGDDKNGPDITTNTASSSGITESSILPVQRTGIDLLINIDL